MSKVCVSRRLHFINSVFKNPGIYSCAVDCFLELSRCLFLPFLSQLSVRNEFLELLFNTLSQYANSTQKDLPPIREYIWLYLATHCSTFRARDNNACFSQIFEERTFGKINQEEASLFMAQTMFKSTCQICQNRVMTFLSHLYPRVV